MIKKIKNKINIKNLFTYVRKNPHILVLLLILGAGVFFAYYNFPYRYQFHDETLRDVAVAISGANQIQFPLVGGFASTGPFTFGPWTYYQLILFSIIVPSNWAPFIYLGITYLASIIMLYLIGKELYDYRFGLILSFLGMMSPTLILATTHLTTSNILTVFVLTATYIFIKIIKYKNLSYWWGFAYGITMGIAMNMNFQAVNLLILALFMLVVKFRKIQYFIAFSAGVILTFIPLLLFDLNNHWNTIRGFLYYLQFGKDLVYVPNSWTIYVRDFWPGFWGELVGVPPLIAFIIMISIAVVLLIQLYKRNLTVPIFLLALAFFIEFIQMRYFWGQRYYGYFGFLRPFVFIFTGYVLYFLYRYVKYGKVIFIVLILIFTYFALPRSFEKLELEALNVDAQRQAKVLQENYPNQQFALYICRESYKSNTADIPKSILFYLEKDNLISENGTPIVIQNWRCANEDEVSTADHPLNVKINEENTMYIKLPSTDIQVLEGVTREELNEAGWDIETLRKIHDNTVRWWFDEKP